MFSVCSTVGSASENGLSCRHGIQRTGKWKCFYSLHVGGSVFGPANPGLFSFSTELSKKRMQSFSTVSLDHKTIFREVFKKRKSVTGFHLFDQILLLTFEPIFISTYVGMYVCMKKLNVS